MVSSVGNSGVARWAAAISSKLDTKNQGFIEKSPLTTVSNASSDKADSPNVDDAHTALDDGGDGSVTKSQLTTALTKLADHLNAQFDTSRVSGAQSGSPPPDGMPLDGASSTSSTADTSNAVSTNATSGTHAPQGQGGPHGTGGHQGNHGDGGGSSSSTGSTSSTTAYDAAADTNGDGVVSSDEEAAYKKTLASGTATASSKRSGSGATESLSQRAQRDPMHELAHAMQLLKAYAENTDSSSTDSIIA